MSEKEFFNRLKLIFLVFCVTVLFLVLAANVCENQKSTLESEIAHLRSTLPPERGSLAGVERDPAVIGEEKLQSLQKEHRSTSKTYILLNEILKILCFAMAALVFIAYIIFLTSMSTLHSGLGTKDK